MCSATKEQSVALNDTIHMSLDDALEYIADDELVEVSLPGHLEKSSRTEKNLLLLAISRSRCSISLIMRYHFDCMQICCESH